MPLLLRLCGSVCAGPPHLFSSLCSPAFGPLSIVVHRPSFFFDFVLRSAIWRCLFSSSGHHCPVGRGSFPVLCLNSLAAHRDLSHLCAARRLLRAARSSRLVDLPSQNLVQNRQYRDTVTCLPGHTDQRFAKVAEVRIICTRSGSIVILLPPTHQQGSRNSQGHQMNQRCTMMTKLVLCSEPHTCAQTAVRQMIIVR